MRANEFIFEDVSGTIMADKDAFAPESLEQIINVISTECAPFISANQSLLCGSKIGRRWPYRGMHIDTRTFITIGQSRADRRPKDTTMFWHTVANEFFTQKFGVPYRNTVFASESLGTAVEYGNPYIILPRGNYSICYSPMVGDFTEELTDPSDKLYNLLSSLNDEDWAYADKLGLRITSDQDMVNLLGPFKPYKRIDVLFSNYIKPDAGPNFDFLDAFRNFIVNRILPKAGYVETQEMPVTPNELMINCQSYYAIAARRPHHFDSPENYSSYLDWLMAEICRR